MRLCSHNLVAAAAALVALSSILCSADEAAVDQTGDELDSSALVVYRIMHAHHDGLGLFERAEKLCARHGVSHMDVLDEFSRLIRLPIGKAENRELLSRLDVGKAFSAAWFAMQLDPGNPFIERAVLDLLKALPDQRDVNLTLPYATIKEHGSRELVEEYRELLKERENKHPRYTKAIGLMSEVKGGARREKVASYTPDHQFSGGSFWRRHKIMLVAAGMVALLIVIGRAIRVGLRSYHAACAA